MPPGFNIGTVKELRVRIELRASELTARTGQDDDTIVTGRPISLNT